MVKHLHACLSLHKCLINIIEASKSATFQESVMDIEDLVQLADNFRACAYYMARESLETSDFIFVPYNYLIDPHTRKTQGIDLSNSIILIDEAHNIEGCATDAYSLTLSSIDIDRAVKDCLAATILPASSEGFNSSNNVAPVVDMESSRQSLQSFQSKLELLAASSNSPTLIKNGDYMLELLKDVQV